MHIALIADAFPPMRSSGAVQLRDLSRELVSQGHRVTVFTPTHEQSERWAIEDQQGVEVLRLRAWRTRDTNYVRRAVSELLMPFLMLRNLRASPAASYRFDGVVWYSPNIFLGPMAKALKKRSNCRSYLILRDIFPEWMADMGLMSRGLAYRLLKSVAAYQYSIADVIGVQTPGNLAYFTDRPQGGARRVEVLQNWLTQESSRECSIDLSASSLAGRTLLIYAGNMGVAQGMVKLLNLAERVSSDDRVGFVFVGRGTDASALQAEARRRRLTNILFYEEIDPDEIPRLYAQGDIGLVCLDYRHKTHNVPGKFISYMLAGLPVLASINPSNDLEDIINREGLGRVSTDPNGADLPGALLDLLEELGNGTEMKARCTAFGARVYSSPIAARQIISALER